MTAAVHGARACPRCNQIFWPKKSHYWICYDCWLAGNAPYPAPNLQALLAERDSQIQRLQGELRLANAQVAGLLAQLDEMRRGADEFKEEMLPRLIQLCHPDKHGNSEAANRVTQWLLRARKEMQS